MRLTGSEQIEASGDYTMNNTTGASSAGVLEEMTGRIAERLHPQKIILFGSRARGDQQGDSDFDLLIIAPSDEPRWRRTVPLYGLLAGVGVPKDIVWWTPEEVAEWGAVKSHFINVALRQGVVLYEAAA
jgi:predicted nucleotidyltransferase